MEIEDDAQNRDREHPVPAAVIHRMIEHWEVPDLTEAHAVECVIR
jgi:tRNA uridine 5-carbamoylmethylation protein Kti12